MPAGAQTAVVCRLHLTWAGNGADATLPNAVHAASAALHSVCSRIASARVCRVGHAWEHSARVAYDGRSAATIRTESGPRSTRCHFAWWGVVSGREEHAAAELAFVDATDQAANAAACVVVYGCSRVGARQHSAVAQAIGAVHAIGAAHCSVAQAIGAAARCSTPEQQTHRIDGARASFGTHRSIGMRWL